MRPYTAVGLILIVMGILVLCVQSITYFSTEQVAGPLGFFVWDVSRPHTIFFNPLAGMLAIGAGIGLMWMEGRSMLR